MNWEKHKQGIQLCYRAYNQYGVSNQVALLLSQFILDLMNVSNQSFPNYPIFVQRPTYVEAR